MVCFQQRSIQIHTFEIFQKDHLFFLWKHSIWTCNELRNVETIEFFRKMKLTPEHGLLKVPVERSSSIF